MRQSAREAVVRATARRVRREAKARWRIFAILAAVVVAADQLTKEVVRGAAICTRSAPCCSPTARVARERGTAFTATTTPASWTVSHVGSGVRRTGAG